MSQAVAGHGATIAYEADPSGSPGTFTVIAELNGDITWPELNRPETETTPHQDDIDDWVLGRLGRGPLTFSVNFIYDDPTHDHLTGLYKKIIDNELFGLRLRGPGGTAADDEWIASGHVQAITQMSPVREGARTADVTVRLRKQQIIDGVSVGTAI
jgi:hypothetical protein